LEPSTIISPLPTLHSTVGRFAFAGLFSVLLPAIYALFAFQIFDWLLAAGIPPWAQSAGASAIILAGFFAAARATTGGIHWRSLSSGPAIRLGVSVLLLAAAAATVNADFPAKYTHLPEYLILGWIIARLVRPDLPFWAGLAYTLGLIGAAALLDETLQGYLPSRSFGLRDFAVDILAGSAGALLAYMTSPGRKFLSGSEQLAFATALIPFFCAIGFSAYALSRFASLNLAPEKWVLAAMLISMFAAFAVAAITDKFSTDRAEAPTAETPTNDQGIRLITILVWPMGCLAFILTIIHGVTYFVPLVFH
jgi:VanZ family protein